MFYFDVIELGGGVGVVTIKFYYNVGGLFDDLEFDFVELLCVLFKDEVCVVGVEFGLFECLVWC